jgi:outer membrane immunogenic protein
MKKLLLTGAAFAALMTSASAADLAARPYMKAAPLSPVYDWSGFYIGAHGGYAWSDSVTIGATGIGAVTGSTNDLKGGFGGGQVGYNWQIQPNWVFGIEADAAAANIHADLIPGLASTKIDSLGSVTARLGYAANNWLFYAKGGFGWADNKVNVLGLSDSQFHTGWTVGGGVEYGITRNWSIKGEYQYYDLGNETYFANTAGLVLGATIHTVKGGVNYRF